MEKNLTTKAAATISSAALLSRLMGLARDALMAHLLGAGIAADIMLAAFRVPYLMRRLFAEGSLTLAFVPRYVRLAQTDGPERADAFARSVLRLSVVGSIILVGISGYFSEHWTWILAPGLIDSKDTLEITAELVRYTLGYIPFICALAVCMGVLNSKGYFLGPALAPVTLNGTLIFAGLCLLATGATPEKSAWVLCAVMPIAGLLQWCTQQPFLRISGFQWHGPIYRKDQETAAFFRVLPETLTGASSHQLNVFLGGILASFTGPGSISQLYFAQLLAEFPLGVLGMAVGIAALPEFSGLIGKKDAFSNSLRKATDLALLVSVPAAAGLAGIAPFLGSVLFGHGAFDTNAVTGVTAALYGLAPALPAVSVNRVFLSACQALGLTRATMVASLVSLLVTFITGYIGMGFIGTMGVALGISAGAYSMLFLLGLTLRDKKAAPGCQRRDALVVLCASAAILGYCMLLQKFWSPVERLDQVLFLLATVPVCTTFYGLVVFLADCDAARALLPNRSTKRR